jgi:hypothetical protein
MRRTNQKLTFQKREFRVLEPRELARIHGGNGEKDGKGEMELDGEMVLTGEMVPPGVK